MRLRREVQNAMVALVERVAQLRAGVPVPGAEVVEPRPK